MVLLARHSACDQCSAGVPRAVGNGLWATATKCHIDGSVTRVTSGMVQGKDALFSGVTEECRKMEVEDGHWVKCIHPWCGRGVCLPSKIAASKIKGGRKKGFPLVWSTIKSLLTMID